jgi:hypothetical protein
MHDEEDDADEEQEPGNLSGNSGYAEQAERSSHETDDEENQRVVKHVESSWTLREASAMPEKTRSIRPVTRRNLENGRPPDNCATADSVRMTPRSREAWG